uniref:B box-type domain-containing protein n=1 Tax=Eutreptiella gymnastica TaxID=73025 RepID=A0A7S1NVY3_9EUGL
MSDVPQHIRNMSRFTDNSIMLERQGPICDVCGENTANYRCDFPGCDGELMCEWCDGGVHRAAAFLHHERKPLGHCESCLFREAEIICPGCDNKKMCRYCDDAIHKCHKPKGVLGSGCEFCGLRGATIQCLDCPNRLCAPCDELKHRHSRRANHRRHPADFVVEGEELWLRQVPDGPELPPPKKIVLTTLELEQAFQRGDLMRKDTWGKATDQDSYFHYEAPKHRPMIRVPDVQLVGDKESNQQQGVQKDERAPTIISSVAPSPTQSLRRPMAPAVGTLAGSQARLMAPVVGAQTVATQPGYPYMATQPSVWPYTTPATAVYPAPSVQAFITA